MSALARATAARNAGTAALHKYHQHRYQKEDITDRLRTPIASLDHALETRAPEACLVGVLGKEGAGKSTFTFVVSHSPADAAAFFDMGMGQSGSHDTGVCTFIGTPDKLNDATALCKLPQLPSAHAQVAYAILYNQEEAYASLMADPGAVRALLPAASKGLPGVEAFEAAMTEVHRIWHDHPNGFVLLSEEEAFKQYISLQGANQQQCFYPVVKTACKVLSQAAVEGLAPAVFVDMPHNVTPTTCQHMCDVVILLVSLEDDRWLSSEDYYRQHRHTVHINEALQAGKPVLILITHANEILDPDEVEEEVELKKMKGNLMPVIASGLTKGLLKTDADQAHALDILQDSKPNKHNRAIRKQLLAAHKCRLKEDVVHAAAEHAWGAPGQPAIQREHVVCVDSKAARKLLQRAEDMLSPASSKAWQATGIPAAQAMVATVVAADTARKHQQAATAVTAAADTLALALQAELAAGVSLDMAGVDAAIESVVEQTRPELISLERAWKQSARVILEQPRNIDKTARLLEARLDSYEKLNPLTLRAGLRHAIAYTGGGDITVTAVIGQDEIPAPPLNQDMACVFLHSVAHQALNALFKRASFSTAVEARVNSASDRLLQQHGFPPDTRASLQERVKHHLDQHTRAITMTPNRGDMHPLCSVTAELRALFTRPAPKVVQAAADAMRPLYRRLFSLKVRNVHLARIQRLRDKLARDSDLMHTLRTQVIDALQQAMHDVIAPSHFRVMQRVRTLVQTIKNEFRAHINRAALGADDERALRELLAGVEQVRSLLGGGMGAPNPTHAGPSNADGAGPSNAAATGAAAGTEADAPLAKKARI